MNSLDYAVCRFLRQEDGGLSMIANRGLLPLYNNMEVLVWPVFICPASPDCASVALLHGCTSCLMRTTLSSRALCWTLSRGCAIPLDPMLGVSVVSCVRVFTCAFGGTWASFFSSVAEPSCKRGEEWMFIGSHVSFCSLLHRCRYLLSMYPL